MVMERLTLVSHNLCPYVQRAAIALVEKRVAFDRVNVDLSDKPEWFLAISPLGKVPLLRVNNKGAETVIFDSIVILEYLDETQPNPLHPTDPLERARHRSWMEFGSAMLSAIARFYTANDEATFGKEADGLGSMADRLEAELDARNAGPWFDGARFSLVDAVFAPVFRYFDAFETQVNLQLVDNRPKLTAWRGNLAQRKSVRTAVEGDFPERLKEHLRSRGDVMRSKLAA